MSEDEVRHWNGPDGERWVALQDRYDAQLEPFLVPLLDAAALDAHDSLVDIGCGCATTTLRASTAVTRAVGVDISEPMLARARERAEAEELPNVEFVRADAQREPFGDNFSVAISRFGVMFFDDPPVAFARIAEALAPRGRLAFMCWREQARNEWVSLPLGAATPFVADPVPAWTGPGPHSLADRDALHALLATAAFRDIDIAPFETSIYLGGPVTVDDSLAFFLGGGSARDLFARIDPGSVERATEAVRAVFAAHHDGTGVRFRAAAWLVSAVRK